ncbi:MAG: serine/threonine-protein kinase, partial [Frankia sp.]
MPVRVLPLRAGDPRRLGPYLLQGRLGQGGMGTVYLGRTGNGPWLAIKVIRDEYASDDDFRNRFRREAENARRVARFCTASVVDADPDGNPPYLVTEYVEGPTLSRAVATNGPMRSADLEQLAVNVATALTAIHNAGIVHRDLTPANVLLSSVGPKVIDFGVARATDLVTVAREAQRIGTPGFMAPEQASGNPVGAAADIFAWGGIIIYAGSGRLPFGEGATDAVLYRVIHEQPRLEGLDGTLRTLVEQAMRKDPATRPTAQALLMRLVGEPMVATALGAPVTPTPPPGASGPAAGAPPAAVAGSAPPKGGRGSRAERKAARGATPAPTPTPTPASPARPAPAPRPSVPGPADPAPAPADPTIRAARSPASVPVPAPRPVPAAPGAGRPGSGDTRSGSAQDGRRKRRTVVASGILALAIAGTAVAVVVTQGSGSGSASPPPDLVAVSRR